MEGARASASLNGLPLLIYLALAFAYYILREGYPGQTVGKMPLDLGVIREDSGEVPVPRPLPLGRCCAS